MPRERSWSTSSKGQEKNISTKTNSTAQVSDNSAKGDSESDDIDGDYECNQGPCKGRLHPIETRSISSVPDHLDSCLLYWQDTIYPGGYKA